jgi:hypothetical protein
MAVVVVVSILAAGGAFVGVAAGASDAVSIGSATEYGDGTIELVFNRSVTAVDWVDVYVDGTDVGRVTPSGSGDRIEITSPTGDVTPNRNLTVVAQVDRSPNDDQRLRKRDISVSATTIDAGGSEYENLSDAAATFRGEPIAFVANGATDEWVNLTASDGDPVFNVTTGADSEVLVFDSTSLTPGTTYNATFEAGERRHLDASDLGLRAVQLTDRERYLRQFVLTSVVAAVPRRNVTAELVARGRGVVDTSTFNLGPDRRGTAVLAAPRPGTYSIEVTDNATGIRADAGEVEFVVAPAASGRPLLSASNGRDGVDPGAELDLPINVVNNGSVEVGSLVNPLLTNRVTTARGLEIRIDPNDVAPMTVHAGTYGVGSLPGGRLASLDVPVSIDHDADPGTYRVPINVSYRYTAEIHENGTEETENVTRDLNVTLTVDRAPDPVVRNVTTSVRAGETGTVTVRMENVGDATAADAQVEVTARTADLGLGGGRRAARTVGEWPPGAERTIAFEASPAAGSAGQSYPLELTVRYTDTDGRMETTTPQHVSIQPLPGTRFRIGAVDGELTVGEEGRVTGTVTNTGIDSVRDAVLVLDHEDGSLEPLETRSLLGALEQNGSAEFSFPVQVADDAEPGPRQFSVFVRHRGPDDAVTESRAMDVRARVGSAPTEFGVEALNATVVAGTSGHLNLSVTNAGQAAFSDITARVFPGGPLSTSEPERHVERLGPGSSTTVSIPVDASGGAMEKAYPVSVILKYTDSNGERAVSETFRQSVEVIHPVEESDGSGPLPIAVAILAVVLAGYGFYRWRR